MNGRKNEKPLTLPKIFDYLLQEQVHSSTLHHKYNVTV